MLSPIIMARRGGEIDCRITAWLLINVFVMYYIILWHIRAIPTYRVYQPYDKVILNPHTYSNTLYSQWNPSILWNEDISLNQDTKHCPSCMYRKDKTTPEIP